MAVDAIAGMVIGGYVVINDEMFQVVQFPSSTSVEVTRAVEGTTAQAHSSGDSIAILQQKVVGQDEVIEDFSNAVNTIRVSAANISFAVDDYIKVNNEFFKLTSVTPDATGITVLQLADEKTVGATDGQNLKIRYRYSQCRLTAHDFLDVGTGSKANTNYHSSHCHQIHLLTRLLKTAQVVFTTSLLTKMVTSPLVDSLRLNRQLVRQLWTLPRLTCLVYHP